METEFKPRFSDRGAKEKKLNEVIKSSLKERLIAEVEAMSLEEKKENHYVAIEIKIPETREVINKAIDEFIEDFTPLEDNGWQLLEFLDFDEDPDKPQEGRIENSNLYNTLHAQIKPDETKAEEIVAIVKGALLDLPANDLKALWVFGIPVTEEEAKSNVETWVDSYSNIIANYLFYYAVGDYNKRLEEEEGLEEDAITYSAITIFNTHKKLWKQRAKEENREEEPTDQEGDAEDINDYKDRVGAAIKKYPNETQAYCRAWVILINNYSEREILSTVNTILKGDEGGLNSNEL